MTAYVIVHFTVKDQEKLAQYGAGAGATLAAFGGEFVTRGTVTEVLHGSHDHKGAVLLKLPQRRVSPQLVQFRCLPGQHRDPFASDRHRLYRYRGILIAGADRGSMSV